MTLKLQIVKDGEVVFEMPLSSIDWQKETLEDELDSFEAEFQKFSKIFDALSSETRLMMMRKLMENEDHTANFTDFMRTLDLNPKLVRDNARKLSEGGLLKKVGRGRYHCSELGESSFIMVSLALKKFMDAFEEF